MSEHDSPWLMAEISAFHGRDDDEWFLLEWWGDSIGWVVSAAPVSSLYSCDSGPARHEFRADPYDFPDPEPACRECGEDQHSDRHLPNPDACEHGARLKNHCATCAAIAETEGR